LSRKTRTNSICIISFCRATDDDVGFACVVSPRRPTSFYGFNGVIISRLSLVTFAAIALWPSIKYNTTELPTVSFTRVFARVPFQFPRVCCNRDRCLLAKYRFRRLGTRLAQRNRNGLVYFRKIVDTVLKKGDGVADEFSACSIRLLSSSQSTAEHLNKTISTGRHYLIFFTNIHTYIYIYFKYF
jgi:hypothetical protein